MSSFRSQRSAVKPYTRPTNNGKWVHDMAPSKDGRAQLGVPGSKAAPNSALLVSNLHYEITPKDLTSIFGQIGTLSREPLIRYDRSDRSLGIAVISFETTAEATRAKKQFDGILAKGQPMEIVYDTPRQPRDRSASAPTSLIQRIQKPPLLERLSRDDIQVKPSGPRTSGPIRNRGVRPSNAKQTPAGGKPISTKGNGARASGSGGKKSPPKAKTAEELDKELDAFMGDSETTVAPTQGADVEMA